jgi:phosphonate transport system substrate-binding protein
MENYRKVATYLSNQLGLEVKLTIMSRYGELLQRFQSLKLDGAFLSSYTAALAIRELELEPLARPVGLKGADISHGLLFARRDSGIRTVAAMRGRTIAFVDPATAAGYLFPLAYLHQHGVRDPAAFFTHQYFTGSHASAIFAVLDGRADLGAAKDTVFNRLVEKDPTIGRELTILAESPALPETTICLKKDLPVELRQRLLSLLLEMAGTAPGRQVLANIGAQSFTPASREDYRVVLELEKEAGLAGPPR